VALHLAAASAPGSRYWQEAVLKLQQVGDGISVEYLQKMKVSQLKDDDQRIVQETIAAIEQRLNDESILRPAPKRAPGSETREVPARLSS